MVRLISWSSARRWLKFDQDLGQLVQLNRTSKMLMADRDYRIRVKYWLIWSIFPIEALRLVVLWLFPPRNAFEQLVRFDIFSKFGIKPLYKLQGAITLLVIADIHYLIHSRMFLSKISKLMLRFLKKPRLMILCGRSPMGVVRKSLVVVNMIRFPFVLLVIWCLVEFVDFIIDLWPYFYSITTTNWFVLPTFLVHFFYTNACMALFVYTCKISVFSGCVFTQLLFAYFSAANRLLAAKGLSLSRLKLFMRVHTKLLQIVLDLNPAYGHALVVFIGVNLPLSAMMGAGVIHNDGTPFSRLIFSFLIFGFLNGLVGLHWMTVLYMRRIQSPYARVRSIYVRQLGDSCPLRIRWRVASRIEAFTTHRPYGMTYGSLGLVSAMTFAKCLVLYAKMILIGYKMLRNNN